jgi:hypothetical protein
MTKVNLTTELPVSAETVWATIGNFNALAKWHPAVEKSEESKQGGATVRKLSLRGGGTIVEQLERRDDRERSYSYSIVEGPLPVSGYKSELKVRQGKDASSCVVEWSSEFEPTGAPENEAVKAVRGIYEAGFKSLHKMYGK